MCIRDSINAEYGVCTCSPHHMLRFPLSSSSCGCFLLFFLFVTGASSSTSSSKRDSEPLLLSKYLDQPDLGRSMSVVKGLGDFVSFSGFFTVNKTTGSNTFFWFFPAQNGNPDAPLLVWLQGGPGASSLIGCLSENGPYRVAEDGKSLLPNPGSWNTEFSLLYIDNPIGTGFSFTLSNDGFVSNQEEVGRDLYSFLIQFYTIFYDQQDNDLYITGESYAGKYVPAFAYAIHNNNQRSGQLHVNLKGISIGDGAIDPPSMFNGLSDLMYFTGMASGSEREVIRAYEKQIQKFITLQQWKEAFLVFDELMNGDFYPYGTYFQNITGTGNYFNFLNPVYPDDDFVGFLNLEFVKDALHVGELQYSASNSTVEDYLVEDFMKSVAPWLSTLVENYKVLIYNGQLDIILGPALCENFLRSFKWRGAEGWAKTPKKIWWPKSTETSFKSSGRHNTLKRKREASSGPLGYVKQFHNLTQVVVLAAGHLVPADQPFAALDLITRFVKDLPF
eukprot:TRINITY_DN103_c0_g1_i1.p1 TRINITY_DN103_c0_g1~~TRINITY_DN103_c0_g1_i1.p1  ORF type:complete len:503 (-),score=105.44 TRINITY_DN103_c0_g1_i1:132-1640(-)